jgi:hypothetical protein
MNIRLTDWRDLSVLHRYRNQCLFFDSMLALTRGTMLDWAKALLTSVAPTTGVFTYLASENGHADHTVLGQATFLPGTALARLTCLAPETALDLTGIDALLDYIVSDLGERGAFHIVAEADDCEQACVALHSMGFAIYTRQRIWQLRGDQAGQANLTQWRSCTDQDGINIRSLYNNLTPGLVQQMEPPPVNRLRGMVYYQGQDLLAYVDIKSGPNGIWVQPFIHADFKDVPARLGNLLQNLPGRRQRPVYVCVRSYLSWLEASMDELGAQPGPRQAVMVKRLALSRRVVQPAALPVLEGKQAEPTVPIAQFEEHGFGKDDAITNYR